MNQTVYVKLLSKDQYGRGVGQVSMKRINLFPFNLFLLGGYNHIHMDEYMLNAGLAEVYRGNGAVYGPKGKDSYIKMEETAKSNGIGMWSSSSNNNNRETASEYKARMKKEMKMK